MIRQTLQIIFYVYRNMLYAYRVEYGTLKCIAKWQSEVDSSNSILSIAPKEFEAFLSNNAWQQTIYTILVDIAEEEYQVDNLPILSWSDSKQLIYKKIEQRFRESSYKAWQWLDHVTFSFHKKNRAQKHSFISFALTEDAYLRPWMNALQMAKVRLKGIYSVAQLFPKVIKDLRLVKDTLVISQQPAGIRQTLLINGSLRFSRLSSSHEDLLDQKNVLDEISRTLQYLTSVNILDRNWVNAGNLTIVWLSYRQDLNPQEAFVPIGEFKTLLPNGLSHPVWQFSVVPKFKLVNDVSSDFMAQYLITIFLQKADIPKSGNLLPMKARFFESVANYVMFANYILILMMLTTLGVVGYLGIDWQHQRLENNLLLERKNNDDAQYQSLQAKLLNYPYTYSLASLNLIDRLLKEKVIPSEILLNIAKAFERYENLKLGQIEWRINPSKQISTDVSGGADQNATQMMLEILLSGEILNKTDFSRANKDIEAFAAQLKAVCKCEALIQKYPFDRDLDGKIGVSSAQDGQSQKDGNIPSFEVILNFRKITDINYFLQLDSDAPSVDGKKP